MLFAINSNANQLDALDGVIPTVAEVDEKIRKIKHDINLSQDEKNVEVIKAIWAATSFMPYEDSLSILLKHENIFFSKPSSIKRAIDQYTLTLFIVSQISTHNSVVGNERWAWPLKHSYNEFLQHLIDLTNVEQCEENRKCFKSSDDPNLKVIYYNTALLLKHKYNSNWIDFEKVNSESMSILEEKKEFRTSDTIKKIFTTGNHELLMNFGAHYKKALLYTAHLNRFTLLVNTSTFDKVLEEGEYLDNHFEEVLNWFAQEGEFLPDAAKWLLLSSLEADKYLGKYTAVIKKGKLILNKTAINSKFNLSRDFRHTVLKELSHAYWQTRQQELSNKYKLEALEIELEMGTLNGNGVADLIMDAIYQRDLISAIKYKEILDKECSRTKDDFRCNDIDELLSKLTGNNPDAPTIGRVGLDLDLKEGNIVISNLVPNKPAEKSGIKTGDKILEINGIDIKNYSLPEVGNLIRGDPNEKVTLLINRNNNDKSIKYEIAREKQIDETIIIQNYWLEIAFKNERYINLNYDIRDGNFKEDQIALKLYDDAFSQFLAGGNDNFAAIYAKKYINVLQKLRSQLSSNKSQSINQFTSNQADKIKSIANVFYNVGQYDSAWACQRIIQENEFLDYVRRRGVDKNFLSIIPINATENDYLIKLNANFKESNDLNRKLIELKGNETTDVYKLISTAIKNNKKELELLRKSYSQSLKDESLKNLNATYQPIRQLGLKSNEAAIQFILTNNQLITFVSTPTRNERFVQAINTNQLREDIQKINISIVKQKPIPFELLSSISNLFMKEPLSIISGKGINTLKISIDNTLNAFPLSLLKIDGKNILDSYVLVKTGLGKVVNSRATSKKYVIGYAASKGNSEFSSLPGASKEIEKIMQIKSSEQYSNKVSFVDENFNRKNFTAGLLNNNYFVHIATHFRVEGNTANATKMLLGDGSTLSIEELRDDLPSISADLVTLSACNTGQQFINIKNQTYDGLSTTFQVKGVRNVLSTLWEISDEATADFMTIFYSLLLNNKITPPEALAYAQNIFSNGSVDGLSKNVLLINDKQTASAINSLHKYTNPYYWAAFQISTIN